MFEGKAGDHHVGRLRATDAEGGGDAGEGILSDREVVRGSGVLDGAAPP